MEERLVSRLDVEAKNYRSERVEGEKGGNIYYNETEHEYSAEHDHAIHHDDENHPWGKGTNSPMTYAVRDLTAPKTKMNYRTVDTENGGGSYDIYGRTGVGLGRNEMLSKNIYTKEYSYGQESVGVDESIRGQFVVTDPKYSKNKLR